MPPLCLPPGADGGLVDVPFEDQALQESLAHLPVVGL